MCGRFTQQASWAEVVAFMQPIALFDGHVDMTPAYNIAPSQACWSLRPEDTALVAERMRWGLLPSWSRDPKPGWSTFNARAESMAEKPMFRAAFRHRRCLVPASGYYEWTGSGARKQPYYLHAEQAPLLLMAALWEPPHPQGDGQPTVSIVTRQADGPVAQLHHRVPLMLTPETGADWCRGSVETAAQLALGAPTPPLAWHAVDRRVGNVREQGPQLIEPLAGLL